MAKLRDIQLLIAATTAARAGYTPLLGEPVWDNQEQKLYIGDGSTAGGVLCANILAGATWNAGASTVEAAISPAKLAAAIAALETVESTLSTAAWEAGVSTTESLTTPAKIAAAIAALAAGGLAGLNIQSFTASGTYTPTSGYTWALVFATGGGGAGGAASYWSGVSGYGAGGGAGGTALAVYDCSGGAKTVTIGAGGTGGSGDGGSGGTTTVTGVAVATGGGGGGHGDQASNTSPGAAGTATTGLSLPAQKGYNGGNSRSGGASFWGSGEPPVGNQNAPDSTTVYGSGGPGASKTSSTGTFTGGDGAPGFVLIIEFE